MFRRPEEIGQYFLTRRKGRVIILTIDYSHCFCWMGLMWLSGALCADAITLTLSMIRSELSARNVGVISRNSIGWNNTTKYHILRFISNFACLSCDGKWEEHVTLYEDEQLRKELGKPVGEAFYPLSDVPEIQQEFLRQLEEETAKKASQINDQKLTETGIEKIEKDLNQVALCAENTESAVTTFEEKKKVTSPAREKPEKSVRLIKEKLFLPELRLVV